MLLRPARLGRIGYLCAFALIVFVWISVYGRSRDAIVHRGWGLGTHTFKQGLSFASDPDTSDGAAGVKTKSPYAYVFYATQDTYACSILVNIRQLKQVHKTCHRIFVIVNDQVSAPYLEALEKQGVAISTQTPPPLAEGTEGAGYYADCLLKLYAFRMHRVDSSLKRIIVLDSDQLILKNLDYLFEDKIQADFAAPRAYWIAKERFSTAFMLITLSDRLWYAVEAAIMNIKVDEYDMDVANELFGDTVLMLPGHFVTLNSHWEDWNLPRWFYQPEAVVAGITNGTHEFVLADTRDLNKKEVTRLQDRFMPWYHERRSLSERSDGAAKKKERVPLDLPTLPKQPASFSNLPNTIPDSINPSKHSNGRPHLPGNIVPPSRPDDPSAPPPSLSDLQAHEYFAELYELYNQTSVLHFTAMGKPWSVSKATIAYQRPEAHPLFAEQFLMWRAVAKEVCFGDIVVEI